MRTWIGVMLFSTLCPHCYAQGADGRFGCTAMLEEIRYVKPKPVLMRYRVTVRWRPAPVGIEVLARVSGTNAAVNTDWLPAGFGWVALDYVANLYFRVSYRPDGKYNLDLNIPELGYTSCTWG